jgi:hypothetical protein
MPEPQAHCIVIHMSVAPFERRDHLSAVESNRSRAPFRAWNRVDPRQHQIVAVARELDPVRS